jgi:acyl transferase domain-containing protein/acyl-coenzyme A synthetase/AMP-(fatty) acid ligase/acyl carrier protein
MIEAVMAKMNDVPPLGTSHSGTGGNALSILESQFTVPDACKELLMHEVVELKAASQPQAVALVDEKWGKLSYEELVSRAELVATHLQARFLNGLSGQVVALTMPHSSAYVVCMMAIWKAAGAVIVIEAHFNPELCKEICEEAGTRVAIASATHAPKFKDVRDCQTLVLEGDWVTELRAQKLEATFPKAAVDDLGVLMMTSGTTGKPKTIAGTHYFMHLGARAKELFLPFDEEDDKEAFNVMFVWEVMRPLLYGLTSYVIPDEAILEPSLFVQSLQDHGCTRVLTTPSLLATILQHTAQDLRERLPAMKTWLTCGEILPMKLVRRFHEVLPNCKLVNDYSCWEGGDVAYRVVSPKPDFEPSDEVAASGEVAAGGTVVIVDPETKAVQPLGAVGEVYFGGSAVSSGYYKQAEASAERFVDPFTKEMEQLWTGKWYKSGDGGRLVGEPPILELQGRIDATVKIRGFKIGIPVVEGAVGAVEGVSMCGVVPAYSSPGVVDSLVCYLRPLDGVDFTSLVMTVKKEGVKKIPQWMMPSYFKLMPEEAFSGGEARKLDRKKLATMVDLEALQIDQAKASSQEHGEESSETEDGVRGLVRMVWAKVLNLHVNSLDPEDNFFDAGGHSTLAANIASQLSDEYGVACTVLDIYSHSTLGELMDFLDPEATASMPLVMEIPHISPPEMPAKQEGFDIVGLAGRFPGADDVDAFWENLRKGEVSATFLSKELLQSKGVPNDVLDNRDFVPCAYMINDVDKFDHQFFGIGKHEASLMDPQHRIFVETSYAAMENAGLPPRRTARGGETATLHGAGSVVGVFAAAGIDGYLVHHLEGNPLKDTMNPQDIFLAEIGNEKDYIATRVSYLLDFTGPAMNVNSACSSGLVAAAQAAAAIAQGQCDAAVAGASSITFPNLGYRYQDGLVNSPDGYVRPFDAGAEGTVFGDACAALVIRRRTSIDRDLVWGVMRGFAVSNDGGQKAGYAAPSSSGQAQAIRGALNMMGEDPWSISYVECHATGTRIGDGIEVRGLVDAFTQVGGKPKADAKIALGSVKGNIAHANCAAGVTGLAKVLCMLRARELVPVANFTTLNPKVDLSGAAMYVNTELCEWDAGDKPLRAGVSSFGIGGTNAHTVLEEAPGKKSKTASRPAGVCAFQVLPFSAKSAGALKRGAENLSKRLRVLAADEASATQPDEVAYTLQSSRAEFPLRKALVVKAQASHAAEMTSAERLIAMATVVEETMPSEEELDEGDEAMKKPAVAFVFPGQGSQHFTMGRGLYEQVPLFREAVDRCCEHFLSADMLGFDLRPLLFPSDGSLDPEKEKHREKEFARPSVLQPGLFIVEYALSQVLLATGVSPVAAAGHSLGEYAAAVLGGLLTIEAACGIVAARSKATEALSVEGSMLAVLDWSQEELDSVANGDRKGLWLAAVNSPKHAVISGEPAAIEALMTELQQAGKKSTKLQIKRAFHSALVADAANTLKGLGLPQDPSKVLGAKVPVASNFSGGWMSAAQLRDGTYWAKHMRGTVNWRDNAKKLLKQWNPSVVLEVGPGTALSQLSKACVEKGTTAPIFMQGMRHPKATGTHDVEALLGALGQLWERGLAVDWHSFHTKVFGATSAPSALQLPTYAFDPISLWTNAEKSVYVDNGESAAKPAGDLQPAASAAASVLVRFNDREGREPPIRAYCLPFASGSSTLFATWAENIDEAVEVVSLELPGRGARAEERMPSGDEEDAALLDVFCDAVSADLRGAQYVLVGFSMGGNLCAELALRLAEKGAPPPLALYIAGRKPPVANPSDVHKIDMTNEELAQYAFATPEVSRSPAFLEHVVPLLRADLELDARVERRLSAGLLAGKKIPMGVGLELFCGVTDDVAPFTEAPGWQRFTQTPIGMHYYPGGHEFMKEQRPMLLANWRRDAVGRLVQRRSAELAMLTAQGFAAPGAVSAPPTLSKGCDTPTKRLPLYAVRWMPTDSTRSDEAPASSTSFCINVDIALSEVILNGAVEAMRAGSMLVIVCPPAAGGATSPNTLDLELTQCWQFTRLVQHLLEAGASGRLLILCSAATTGALVCGASKAVAMEAAEFSVQRVFVPPPCLDSSSQIYKDIIAKVCSLADLNRKETDLWVQDTQLAGVAYAPRLEPMMEPSLKLPCVQARNADGSQAVYVLTGATGGLGSTLVDWLVTDQKLLHEQLVLVRRAGSSRPLAGELAKCRIVEVSDVCSEAALSTSALQDMRGIAGVFHLAGLLDDGIIQGMNEERFRKVAEPKCGMLTALIRTATSLQWPLQWVLGFSSTSSLFGYAGQSNYCAANAMLDQMATFGATSDATQGDQLPCKFIAINWGPWGETGMAKVGTKAYEQAVKEGDTPLPNSTALRCLAAVLRASSQARPSSLQFCACDVEWQRSQWSGLPIIDLVASEDTPTKSQAQQGGPSKASHGTSAKEAATTATVAGSDNPQEKVKEFMVLHANGGSWNRVQGKSLQQLGLDSLDIVGMRGAFNKTFNAVVPLAVFADPSKNVTKITFALCEAIGAGAQ